MLEAVWSCDSAEPPQWAMALLYPRAHHSWSRQPLQSLGPSSPCFLCGIPCLSLGLACSHKPWAPAVDWQVASLLRWGLKSKCNVSCSLLGGRAGVYPAPPPPARPSVLCPQSGAHLHRLNKCLWKTGILRVLRLSVKNSRWEEGRKSQRLQCNVRWPVRKQLHRGTFLAPLSCFFPPQIALFSLCPPPDVFTWLKSGLCMAKGDADRWSFVLRIRSCGMRSSWKENVGPSPKSRETGRAVLKEELSASFRRQSRDPKLQEAELGFPSLPNSHFLSTCPRRLLSTEMEVGDSRQ